MKKFQLYAGFLAPLVALTGIGTAAYINRSWWRITENAISDMGRVGLPYNWVMDSAFVIASILGVYCTLALLKGLKNPVQKAGIGTFTAGLFFLGLIGLFPEGTSPHYYVSWAFFVTAGFGILITGIGFYIEKNRTFGAFSITLFVLAWLLSTAAMRAFKGVAVSESIGTFGIVTWYYVLLTRLKEGAPGSKL